MQRYGIKALRSEFRLAERVGGGRAERRGESLFYVTRAEHGLLERSHGYWQHSMFTPVISRGTMFPWMNELGQSKVEVQVQSVQ